MIARGSERMDLDALLQVTAAGPSAVMLANGTLGCGHTADGMLDAATSGDQGTGGGLLLVHSHRQKGADFKRHARMLSVVAATPYRSKGLLKHISLLIINNDAASVLRYNRFAPENPIDWLRMYQIPMRLRMLLLTTLNLGFFCGELQSLAAASTITKRFPWVLYCSGPDAMPTPHGIALLSVETAGVAATIANDSQSGTGREVRHSSFFYDPFPAPPQHRRFSMDFFLFYPKPLQRLPPHGRSLWVEAAHMCLTETTMMPESIVAHVCDQGGVKSKHIGGRNPQSVLQKTVGVAPSDGQSVWHSHNGSNVDAWLAAREKALARRIKYVGQDHHAKCQL